MGKLFGTDGIRGEANRHPMSAAIAFGVGQAVAYVFRKNGHRARVIIGKDTRLSGYMLESSLEAGVTSMGGYSTWSACCRPRASPSSPRACAPMPAS